MAISKDKKNTLVADLTELLTNAKSTVYAKYQGLTVAELQELRKNAREAGVKIKVVKNRLVRVAMGQIAVYKDTDTTGLTGQLLYAISDDDEVMPAKVLAEFAKKHNTLDLMGGFSDLGASLSQDEVKSWPPCQARTNSSRRSSPSFFPQSPTRSPAFLADYQALCLVWKLTQINISNHLFKGELKWQKISRNSLRNW